MFRRPIPLDRWGPLLAIALLCVGGCKSIFQAEVLGVKNREDVPVNVVIHVRYEGDNWVAKKYLSKKYFKLATCEKEAPPTEAKDSQDASKPESPSPVPSPKETSVGVQGKVAYTRTETVSEKDGKRRRITDLYFLPIPASLKEAPLDSDTEYCFSAEEVVAEGPEHEVAMGTMVKFKTERNGFGFAAADEDLSINAPVGGNDWPVGDPALVEFSSPINPTDLGKGTHLCNLSKTTQSSDSYCNDQGVSQSRRIYLLEDFTEDPDTGFIQAAYDLYAISGDPAFSPDTSYALNIGLLSEVEDQAKPVTLESIRFETGDGNAPATPPADLSRNNRFLPLLQTLDGKSDRGKQMDRLTWILIDSST